MFIYICEYICSNISMVKHGALLTKHLLCTSFVSWQSLGISFQYSTILFIISARL